MLTVLLEYINVLAKEKIFISIAKLVTHNFGRVVAMIKPKVLNFYQLHISCQNL